MAGASGICGARGKILGRWRRRRSRAGGRSRRGGGGRAGWIGRGRFEAMG